MKEIFDCHLVNRKIKPRGSMYVHDIQHIADWYVGSRGQK